MPKDAAYRQAEKIIKEAQSSGATKLDLGDMALNRLPPELWKLKNLKALSLGFEKYDLLHKHPRDSTGIPLPIGHNQITQFPKEIGQLTQLQTLFLRKQTAFLFFSASRGGF